MAFLWVQPICQVREQGRAQRPCEWPSMVLCYQGPSQEGREAEIQGALDSSSLEPWNPNRGLRLPERGSAPLCKAPPCIHPGAEALLYPTPGCCPGHQSLGGAAPDSEHCHILPDTWAPLLGLLILASPKHQEGRGGMAGAELYLPRKRSARSILADTQLRRRH